MGYQLYHQTHLNYANHGPLLVVLASVANTCLNDAFEDELLRISNLILPYIICDRGRKHQSS